MKPRPMRGKQHTRVLSNIRTLSDPAAQGCELGQVSRITDGRAPAGTCTRTLASVRVGSQPGAMISPVAAARLTMREQVLTGTPLRRAWTPVNSSALIV
jgi:hypothetical protein